MIYLGTWLDVADNSGAKRAMCIHVHGGSVVKCARVGDIITVVIKKAIPRARAAKSQIYRAVVVRTRKGIVRSDGSKLEFDTNAIVLLDNKGEMIGSRVFGPVPREIRMRGFVRITSLAAEVL